MYREGSRRAVLRCYEVPTLGLPLFMPYCNLGPGSRPKYFEPLELFPLCPCETYPVMIGFIPTMRQGFHKCLLMVWVTGAKDGPTLPA